MEKSCEKASLERLNKVYMDWLVGKVARTKKEKKALKESGLLEYIHSFEFTWTIRNDENRAYDGKKLRKDFLNEWVLEEGDSDDFERCLEDFNELPCSFLEMLIALSYRCERDIMGDVNSPEDHSKDWFWEFLGNIGAKKWLKSGVNFDKKEVKNSVERVINRTFEPSGKGGLFPINDEKVSQIRFEIWDNLGSYLGKWYPL